MNYFFLKKLLTIDLNFADYELLIPILNTNYFSFSLGIVAITIELMSLGRVFFHARYLLAELASNYELQNCTL